MIKEHLEPILSAKDAIEAARTLAHAIVADPDGFAAELNGMTLKPTGRIEATSLGPNGETQKTVSISFSVVDAPQPSETKYLVEV